MNIIDRHTGEAVYMHAVVSIAFFLYTNLDTILLRIWCPIFYVMLVWYCNQ